MDLATDSAKVIPARRARLVIALLAFMVEPGCARLAAFRKDDRPAFGTNVASEQGKPGNPSSTGDLYADRFGKARRGTAAAPDQGPADPEARPVLAGEPGAETTPHDDQRDAERPLVALRPPVAVRPAAVITPAPRENPTQPADGGEAAAGSLAPVTPQDPETPPQGSVHAEAVPAKEPTLAAVLTQARKRLDGLTSYQVKMSHQERVAGTLNPSEDVVLSIRRTPTAVRLEWPGGPHKGREVLYAADARGGMMHVNMADSPIPVPRLSMAPDSPLATRNSRHPIYEAGFDTIVRNMEVALKSQDSGESSYGKIVYAGLETPEGFGKPAHKVVRVTPDRETWVVYLDPDSCLPELVQATAGNGDLLERYSFRDPSFDLPELTTADAFNPDARWGQAKGLFQRIARAGGGVARDVEPR